jgi:hypothetical protein
MLQLLLILVAFVIFVAIVIAIFTEMNWGFFRPRNNIEYVILRGGILDHSICGYPDHYTKRVGKLGTNLTKCFSLLYRVFGICYFGIPFIYKIGTVIVNYPPQLKSTSGIQHTTNEEAPGFDKHHNYLLEVKDVEFQGGITVDLEFSFEAKLIQPVAGWGRNGKFLESLGQYMEGAIKQRALTINFTDFVGKKTNDTENPKEDATEIRNGMCAECMNLNKNTNKGGTKKKVGLAELCGYEIKSISYKDLKPSDENSRKRLNLLEELNESYVRVDLADKNLEIATTEAAAEAVRLKAPGMAKVEVNKAAGMADAEVLKAKREAAGSELVTAALNANAIENTKVSTLIIGGNSGRMPQVILPLK